MSPRSSVTFTFVQAAYFISLRLRKHHQPLDESGASRLVEALLLRESRRGGEVR